MNLIINEKKKTFYFKSIRLMLFKKSKKSFVHNNRRKNETILSRGDLN